MEGMRRAAGTGTGLYAPGRAIPNAEFDERYGLDVDAFNRAVLEWLRR